ncbi:MAG TPA: DUF192 domain-containing protein [Conexibacter sp.]
MTTPRRLRRLASTTVAALPDVDVRVAADPRARLLGLAGLRALPRDVGLLLPGTRSVHTLGMRFPLDLVWLDGAGRIVRIDCMVRPGRVRGCRDARAVIELAGCDEARRRPVVFG